MKFKLPLVEPWPHMVLRQLTAEYGAEPLEQGLYVSGNGPEIEVPHIQLLLVEVGWHGRHERCRYRLLLMHNLMV